ncbi:MAG TPA: UbiD family decarboxylase [Stellaceae bacterium]|nr:UbiD family decarboxylase [Stellaceae bacterium]
MVHKLTVEGREIDLDKFRLRNFVAKLAELGELEIHDEPVALADLSWAIEASPKAKLFKNVGPERVEVAAATAGSRKRLAAAFGVDPSQVIAEFARRLENPQPIVEIPSADAPVHQVVKKGDQIDLTALPFHPQHEYDGGTYISSGIDYTIDPVTGRSNIGCRRLMLRSKDTMRANLTANSDLKKIYKAAVERKERLPVSFVVGSHPLDFMAAVQRRPGDEVKLLATLRGEPVPMVKCLTNNIMVPADAEMVIEGYFDELGYREMEGPYGEMWGYYGPMHIDPVFHVTAITHRRDVLFQTVLHSSHILARGDSPNMSALGTELSMWRNLRKAGIEPAAVAMAPGLRLHGRVALKRGKPGEARIAIATLLKETPCKHVVVVDDDIDVTQADQVEWALCTRFRADQDLVIESGLEGAYMDPTMFEETETTKLGFDATAPYGRESRVDFWRPQAPHLTGAPRYQTVRQALEAQPLFFTQIMDAVGSRDGREVAMELYRLREEGVLDRQSNGEWSIGKTGGAEAKFAAH